MNIIERCAIVALLLAPVAAQASTVVDNLPPTGASYFGNYANSAGAQNFLVRFTLGAATSITGFDILTTASGARLGEAVQIKIRADAAGAPAAANLFSLTDTIDSVAFLDADSRIAGANFSPVDLAAGDYWIGMSSASGQSIGWNSYNLGDAAWRFDQRGLDGDAVMGSSTAIHELGWRIRSEAVTPAAVPEPATWAMMLLGFGGMGHALRRRPKVSARIRFA